MLDSGWQRREDMTGPYASDIGIAKYKNAFREKEMSRNSEKNI